MKIQNINAFDRGIDRTRDSGARGPDSDESLVFRKTMSSLSEDKQRERMAELVNAIDEQSKRLSKRTDITEFEKYRKLIRTFLDEVVSNGYSFTKENAFAARHRHRFFATVKTIDDKLDKMAKDVLSEQEENINLLADIGEIRGLLLDMML